MLVTIGLPFFNSDGTLKNAIQSVFAQTFSDWELILVDDGSTDHSLDIARSVRDPRVKVISDGINRKLPYRLNQIAQLASGAYLARMDADDMMHPERLARQVEILQKHPEIDLVSTGIISIDSQNQPLGCRGIADTGDKIRAVFKRRWIIHPTIMAHTHWFKKNPYNTAFPRAEDFELFCRTVSTSALIPIREPLYFYREGSPTFAYIKNYLDSQRDCRQILLMYGPNLIGWPRTIPLYFETYLKGVIYRAFTRLGIQKRLIQSRNEAGIDQALAAQAAESIEQIIHTPVPGLSDLRA